MRQYFKDINQNKKADTELFKKKENEMTNADKCVFMLTALF